MANPNDTLPEGTDSIINGAGVGAGGGNQDSLITGAQGGGDESISGKRSGSSTGTTSAGGYNSESDIAATRSTGSETGGARARAVETLRTGSEKLSGQAAEKARGLVSQGLERGGEALTNVSRLIGDTATGLDERLGSQYGDYARKAATTIEETAAKLAAKDADELIEDTREFVRKSPGVALAGAAVLGFALVRLVKSGLDQDGNETGGNRTSGGNRSGGSGGTTGSNAR